MGKRKMMNRLKKREEDDKEKSLPELPEEILVEILAKIPPEFLCKTIRYVCKAWCRLISSRHFIQKNYIYHKPGILLQLLWSYRSTSKASFLRHTDDEKQPLGFNITNFSSRMGIIRSSCNGLVLLTEPKRFSSEQRSHNQLCIKNPLTDPTFTLPQCPSRCKHRDIDCSLALGFVPHMNRYKVVHIYKDGYGFEIFTLGSHSNRWRRIPGPFIYRNEFKWRDPTTINGQFYHWSVRSDKYIISMDVSDEMVRKTNLPNIRETIYPGRYELVDMDGKLSFVYATSEFEIDVWVLNDFGRQIWSREHRIIADSINFTTWKGKKDQKEKKKCILKGMDKEEEKDNLSGKDKKKKNNLKGKYKKKKKTNSKCKDRKDEKDGQEEEEEEEEEESNLKGKDQEEEEKDKLPSLLNLSAMVTLRNGEVMLLIHNKKVCDHDSVYLYDFKSKEMKKSKMRMKDELVFTPHRSSLVSWKIEMASSSSSICKIKQD